MKEQKYLDAIYQHLNRHFGSDDVIDDIIQESFYV